MRSLVYYRVQKNAQKRARKSYFKVFQKNTQSVCVKNAKAPTWAKPNNGLGIDKRVYRLGEVIKMFETNVVPCMEEFEGANLTTPAKGPQSLLVIFSLKSFLTKKFRMTMRQNCN